MTLDGARGKELFSSIRKALRWEQVQGADAWLSLALGVFV